MLFRDVPANRKFWVTLGDAHDGRVEGSFDSARSHGSVDPRRHLGRHGRIGHQSRVSAPDVAQFMAKMKAAGWQGVIQRHIAENRGQRIHSRRRTNRAFEDLSENLQFTFDEASSTATRRNGNDRSRRLHHVHFFVPEGSVPEIKAWYGKVFGAVPGKRFPL